MTWLEQIAALLTFYRWTLIPVDVVVVGMSSPPQWTTVTIAIIFCLTIPIIIFNVFIALQQEKVKRRIPGEKISPTPKVSVITYDLFCGLAYLVLWILQLPFLRVSYGNFHYSADVNQYSFVQSFCLVGTLVISIYHFFFACIGTVRWTQIRKLLAARRKARTATASTTIECTEIERRPVFGF